VVGLFYGLAADRKEYCFTKVLFYYFFYFYYYFFFKLFFSELRKSLRMHVSAYYRTEEKFKTEKNEGHVQENIKSEIELWRQEHV